MLSDAQLTDSQRSAAIERIGESLVLRSGAGCGKTFVLARRFLELLRAGDGERGIEQIVALTFTEKAALEMSVRVRRMLADAAGATADAADRDQLLAWLDELPDARISTIHGFCHSLLRSRAVEAGIDPSFSVCSDPILTDRMLSEAAEEAVLTAIEAQSPATALLAQWSFEKVVSLVEQLVSARTACDLSAYADPLRTVNRWRQLLRARRGEWLAPLGADVGLRAECEALAPAKSEGPADRLAQFLFEQMGIVREILAAPADAPPELFARLDPKPGNIGSQKRWGKDGIRVVRARAKALIAAVARYAPFAESLDEPDDRSAKALAALTGLALDANARYAAEKRRRGLLDFTDLLERARRLVNDNEPVRSALAAGIDQLLIDECQDTDACQIDLLTRLAGTTQGRLFAVGDVKQSIYRFRGAQVEVFRRLCELLGESRQEHLSVSFRTHGAGTAFVNEVFSGLMGADYVPIQAARTELPPKASVEILLAAPGALGSFDAAGASRAQAAVVAQQIADMLDDGEQIVWDADAKSWRAVRAGDVAILFARMTNSLDYERELQRRSVPYYVIAGTGFFRQQEVFDVLNALAAIEDPFDDIALFGTLRSSLFGLTDNTLMHLAESCSPPYFASLTGGGVVENLDTDQAEALAAAVDLLARLHRVKDAVATDALLERLLDATGYEATVLSQFQGRRMLGNVRQVVDLARASAADGVSLGDFLTETRRQVLSESRYEQAAVAGERENVVRLMTIHKAKGLQFPVVVVPDLNAGHHPATGPLLVRGDWGLTLRYLGQAGGEDNANEQPEPLTHRLARWLEDEEDRAEDIRRLYVAVTRHQDHLILAGADWRARDGGFRQSNGYLAALDEQLGIGDALEAGKTEIPYGQGRFAVSLRQVSPVEPPAPSGHLPVGNKLLAEAGSGAELADAMARAARAGPGPACVGPLDAAGGRVEIAITALGDFEHCPMLYRWRYELRVPGPVRAASAKPAGDENHELGAATLGTLYHLCMQHLDFTAPQAPRSLIRRAAGEMSLPDTADLDALARRLAEMLATLREHELWGSLASAREVFRELDFVMDCGRAELRGQIDLLYIDAAGEAHVVDYKSDAVTGEAVAGHARRYELQLLLYALAAARHRGAPVSEAALYFLRPGRVHGFDVRAASLSAVEVRAAALAEALIRSRRTGRFERRRGEPCRVCPYAGLCDELDGH